MRIALDFDATYTADPELWDMFVDKAKDRGHDIRIVTARYADPNSWDEKSWVQDGNTDIEEAAKRLGIPVIYCDMVQKQDVWGADIWIDDNPHMVVGLQQARYLMRVVDEADNQSLTGFGRSLNNVKSDDHLA